MTEFNLRQLVREVLAASTMADPGDLADEVSRRIGDEDLRSALDQALRTFVREEITRQRMRRTPAEELASLQLAQVTTSTSARPVVLLERPSATPSMRLPAAAPKPAPARSAKVAGIREWWRAELKNPIHVGEKQWLPLGDCGFDELMFAAAERRDMAERNAARAKSFTRLAEAVRAAGVERVRDLPVNALSAHFGGAAA